MTSSVSFTWAKNKAPGDMRSIKSVQIAEWKISEELAPMGCFASGKQFCVDIEVEYTCMPVHTSMEITGNQEFH